MLPESQLKKAVLKAEVLSNRLQYQKMGLVTGELRCYTGWQIHWGALV